MEKQISASGAIGNVVRMHVSSPSPSMTSQGKKEIVQRLILSAVEKTFRLSKARKLPSEILASRQAFYGQGIFASESKDKNVSHNKKHLLKEEDDFLQETKDGILEMRNDQLYSFQAFFGGFVFSIVDSTPSEIAVAFLRDVDVKGKWNSRRTTEASGVISIGWLQIDNHCPNAPFPVALCPDVKLDNNQHNMDTKSKLDPVQNDNWQKPFMGISLKFAPQHRSGISVSVSLKFQFSHLFGWLYLTQEINLF